MQKNTNKPTQNQTFSEQLKYSRFAVTPCVISTVAKLRYRFWKEPNRTTRISTVAKWEIWFRENHGDFTGTSLGLIPISTMQSLKSYNSSIVRWILVLSICSTIARCFFMYFVNLYSPNILSQKVHINVLLFNDLQNQRWLNTKTSFVIINKSSGNYTENTLFDIKLYWFCRDHDEETTVLEVVKKSGDIQSIKGVKR